MEYKFKAFDLSRRKWNKENAKKTGNTLKDVFEPEEFKETFCLNCLDSDEDWRVVMYTGLNYKNGNGVFGGDVFIDSKGTVYRVWQVKGGFMLSNPTFVSSLFAFDVLVCTPLADAQNISWFESEECVYAGNAEENPLYIFELMQNFGKISIEKDVLLHFLEKYS
jgi:hypothetical protein